MGEKYLTPLNVQEELTHSFFLSFVSIIMLILLKSLILECSPFIIRLIVTFNLPHSKSAHFGLKNSNHLSLGRMDQ